MKSITYWKNSDSMRPADKLKKSSNMDFEFNESGNVIYSTNKVFDTTHKCKVAGRSDISFNVLFSTHSFLSAKTANIFAISSPLILISGWLLSLWLNLMRKRVLEVMDEELARVFKMEIKSGKSRSGLLNKIAKALLPSDARTTFLLNQRLEPLKCSLKKREESIRDLEAGKAALEAKTQVADQVRHDLRNPLMYLKVLAENSTSLNTQDKKQLYDISNTIETCIDEVGGRKKQNTKTFEILEFMADRAIERKRAVIESLGLNIEIELQQKLKQLHPVSIHSSNFDWVISNILQNAMDAIAPDEGKIIITFNESDTHVEVLTSDNGNGIDEDSAKYVFNKNFTQGKPGGSGLGLFSAKQKVEGWGRKINMTPKDQGVQVIFSIPKTNVGGEYYSKSVADEFENWVLVDDSESVHTALEFKYPNKKIKSFKNSQSFRERTSTPEAKENGYFVLLDQNLGENSDKSGLETLATLSTIQNIALFTDAHDEPKIIQKCSLLGAPILPKSAMVI